MKALVLALCLALPMSAIAADHRGRSWQEIINDSSLNKTPSAAQIQKFSTSAVKAASGPQTFLVADRFLFLFDSDGSAVVTFDLTMDDIGIKDMIMGAVGIGQFSVEGIFKLFRDIFEKPTKLADGKAKGVYARADGKIAESWADMDAHTFLKTSDQNIEDGYKAFAKLEFADRWIAKSGQKSMTGEQRAGYQPADFTLGDLYVKPELRAQAEELFNRISIVLFKATLAEMGGLEQFTDQFQMKWDAGKQQFNMLWAPSKQAKRPELPGWVVNYAYPTDTLAYKLSLNQVERLVSSADLLFGKYGAVAAILVSRVTNSIKARLDSHENSLLTFLEGAAAGTYDLGMPLQDA
ncbi:MAG TPA: hypothetical protein VM598_04975, partial [Bdellovibrionota bacterium]|nr:hypothetical protein [Bdellovibrionota bacterium]